MAEAAAPPPEQRPAGPRPWRRALAIAAALLLALVAVANVYVIATTRARIVAGVGEAPPRPVAVVLGNKVANGTPSGGLAERLEVALELYRTARVQRLIVSGAVHGDYDEPRAMAAWLVQRGVPASAIILDGGGHRTAATMADVAAMGVRAALICTQPYHLPRALYLARHAGVDALGVPSSDRRASPYETIRSFVREGLARAETVVEVAFRGVRRS
jgi:SanA protein